MRYKAAWIKAKVEVEAYAEPKSLEKPWLSNPRRTVELSFNESFSDDEGLDLALEAFGAAVRGAARR